MSRRLLVFALAGSVLLNAALLTALARRPASASTTQLAPAATVAKPKPAPIPRPAATLRDDFPAPELHTEVIRLLQRRGTTPIILSSVANALVEGELRAARSMIRTGTTEQVWRYRLGGGLPWPADLNRARALDARREERLTELLGPDIRAALSRGLATSDPTYAEIPTEKVLQIEALRRAHARLETVGQNPFSADERKSIPIIIRKEEAALHREIGRILTPQEFARYELYHSPLARDLQHDLDFASIDDAQYEAIYAAVAREPHESEYQRICLTVSALQEFTNADLAVQFLRKYERDFRLIAELLQQSGVSCERILDLHQYHNPTNQNLFRDRESFERAEQLYDEVTKGLTPEAKASFDRTFVAKRLIMRRTLPPPRPTK